MRIAVVSLHACPLLRAGERNTGGLNVYVLEMAREMARRGALVDVFTLRHQKCDRIETEISPGARVVHLDAGKTGAEKQATYPLIKPFVKALENFRQAGSLKYDVISAHYWLSGLAGIELRKLWRVPLYVSFHSLIEVKRRFLPTETDVPERSPGERTVVAQADKIVAWTEHERDALVRLYDAVSDRVEVIPPGVDLDLFSPLDPAASRRRLRLHKRQILFVGRLEPLKGVDILLRAFAELGDAGDAELTLVGGAQTRHEKDRLRGLADSLQLASRVRFTGSVDRTVLPDYYNAADVCVIPSYYESFGLVALEAAACGVPVVASAAGGLPRAVKDLQSGYLVRQVHPTPFAARIQGLLRDSGRRRRMGAAARRHAESLGWAVTGQRLMASLSDARS